MTDAGFGRCRSLVLLVLALRVAGGAPAFAAKAEFAQPRFVVEEGSEEAMALVSLRDCAARSPTGVARVRVVGGGDGDAVEGEDFFVFEEVELGSVSLPDGGYRVARLAQVRLLVPADDRREGEETFSLRLEPLESTLDCGAGPEPITVGPVAEVVLLDQPSPPESQPPPR